ncbi:hypothetical protein HU200_044506 [Digitaria exilis]|uniref:Uncharacterized protein n=1 Tax=Digitaria exilis TaxID=1010633 RepID=A0A835EF39_9POAL|nr:hypothetical protein HU200_044506 [Digitaria exilis]
MVNNAIEDGTKIALKFCTRNWCGHIICYCCQNELICYSTREDCQANCPTCTPECPPQPSPSIKPYN